MAALADAETSRPRMAILSMGPLAIFFACFAIWLALLIAGTAALFDIPAWGATYAPGKDGAIRVVTIAPQGQLARAGIEVGDEIVAVQRLSDGAAHRFTPLSAIATRPQAGSYAGYEAARAERNLIWTFVREDVRLQMADGRRIEISASPRLTIGDFNGYFFMNVAIGVLVLAAGLGIAVFARHDSRTVLVGVAGFCLSLILLNHALEAPAALYRPPLLDRLCYVLSNMFGYGYAYALLGLVLLTPPFDTRVPIAGISAAFGLAVFPLQHWQVIVFPLNTFLFPYLMAIVLGVAMMIVQFMRARDKPLDRASITWISVSILGAVLPWAAGFLLPQVFDRPPFVGESAGGILVALTWAGFVLATLRYRLFAIQKIWLVTVLSMTAIVVFVLTDLALLSLFDLGTIQAASVALVVTTWAIIPLKSAAFAYWLHRHDWPHDMIVTRFLDDVGELKDPSEINGRLLRFLTDIFGADRLELSQATPAQGPAAGPTLEDNGLTLAFPAIGRPATARMIGRNRGRSLFSSRDRQLVQLLLDIARIIHSQHETQDTTRRKDRDDLARDLHDHLGAHLLNLFYATRNDKQLHAASSHALEALRDSILLVEDDEIHDLAGSWADLWSGQQARLGQSGIDCDTETDFRRTRVVDGRFLINLKRIVEEAVTNILKHGKASGAATISATVTEDGAFLLDMVNDATDTGQASVSGGRGLVNIQSRVAELGGTMSVSPQDSGRFRLAIRLPLPD